MSTFLTLHPENLNVAIGIVPIDLATGANTGDIVHMDYYGECLVVLIKEAGAAGEPPIITVNQVKEIGGTPKALTVRGGYGYVKKGADLLAIDSWTKTAMTTANTLNLTAGDNQAIAALHIRATDLDYANGYNCIQASVAKTGATGGQLGTLIYIMGSPRWTPAPGIISDTST